VGCALLAVPMGVWRAAFGNLVAVGAYKVIPQAEVFVKDEGAGWDPLGAIFALFVVGAWRDGSVGGGFGILDFGLGDSEGIWAGRVILLLLLTAFVYV